MTEGGALGLIPARGGSKAIPRKNLVDVGGKPLIVWTIEAALGARTLNRVILSSEDEEIISVARSHGCDVPFVRPGHLATDTTSAMKVAQHAIDTIDEPFQYLVYLQPTSPLRTSQDIDDAVRLCREARAPSCASVSEVKKSPYWMYTLDAEGHLISLLNPAKPVQRRQDAPPVFALNGAVYVARIDWLKEQETFVGPGTIAYLMPHDRSLDLDGLDDLEHLRSKLSR